MKSTRKCPTCGQWSTWTQAPTDRCPHCGQLLDPSSLARQQAQEERKAEEKERFTMEFIEINPHDSFFLKFIKRIGLGFQLAFVAIMSFILWLIALLAG